MTWDRGVRTVLFVIFFLLPSLTFAQNTHRTLPSNSSTITDWQNYLKFEMNDRHTDMFSSFVVANCTHGTSGTMVSSAFACTAYGSAGGYISQSAAAIDYSAAGASSSDTCWVVATEATTGSIGGNFTRVSGTHYGVNCVD